MATPIIIDTDIGFDVDDVWALAFALRCPELDIKLITTATGDTGYRARVVAKMLEIAGREDIPIGVGIPLDASDKTHAEWLGDFSLSDYQGEVLRDGIGALCDTVMESPEVMSIVCIGPLPNIAAALAREPEITNNARFVGMHGSLRRGYLGAPKPMREYNVHQNALSCQAAFVARWEKVITPLDTCGTIVLDGERFARVAASDDPLTRTTLECHHAWFDAVKDWKLIQQMDGSVQSSILYDSVAVYLAFAQDLVEMETLDIEVTDDGKTMIVSGESSPGAAVGRDVRCATDWVDKDAFLDLLVERLA